MPAPRKARLGPSPRFPLWPLRLRQPPRPFVRRPGHPRPINPQILAHPLHVIASLIERDALDPLDRVGSAGARVAIGLDPLLDAAWAGVVGGEGEDWRAAFIAQELAKEVFLAMLGQDAPTTRLFRQRTPRVL